MLLLEIRFRFDERRSDITFEKHCFWGEHRPLQQSVLELQVPPLLAQDGGASEGPWEDDSKGICEGAAMEGPHDGSREGIMDDMGAPIDGSKEGVTIGDGIVDGPDDGSKEGIMDDMGAPIDGSKEGVNIGEGIVDGPDDGSKEGIMDDMGAPIDGSKEGVTIGEGIVDGPDEGSKEGMLSIAASGTANTNDLVVPEAIWPATISSGGSETTMAKSVMVPRNRSRIEASESSTTSIT
jgi:hypothetical protein